MNFDYAELAQDAAALLEEFGSTGTLTSRTTSGAYDPATGTHASTSQSQTITAVVVGYPVKLIDGVMVLQGDELAYVAAPGLSFLPAPPQTMSWQGRDYTVISAKDLAPAGLSVLWELHVRR